MEQVEEKKPKNNEERPKFVARTPTDIQRIKLEKLMKNPVRRHFTVFFLIIFAQILIIL